MGFPPIERILMNWISVIAAVAATCLVSCRPPHHHQAEEQQQKNMPKAVPENLSKVVHDYIRTHEGWSVDSYRLTDGGIEGSFVAIHAIHVSDEVGALEPNSTVVGGGLSLTFIVDPLNATIVDVLAFQ